MRVCPLFVVYGLPFILLLAIIGTHPCPTLGAEGDKRENLDDVNNISEFPASEVHGAGTIMRTQPDDSVESIADTGDNDYIVGGRKKKRVRRKTVTVDTALGVVMGFEERHTNTFLGIPYAEPPLGTFRYRPPRPKEPWAPNVVKAFDFSNECLQSSLYSGSKRPNAEDCLYLNVWTPKNARYIARTSSRDSSELLPVMIWIYGGAFLHGGAGKPEYIGTQLARRGVIVVSCNYRLGALGFLVSTVDGLYGNYGLADQKMAMMWVQQHIRSFGGDPSRVTVFGESAGAMSLGLHIFDQHQRQQRQKRMGEPQTSLFQAAILQSNPFGYRFRSMAVANFLGTEFKERLDCEDLRCLQSESADELIHVQDTLMAVPRNIGDFFTWGPVITDEHFWREFRLRPGPWANMTVRQPLNVITQLSAQMTSLLGSGAGGVWGRGGARGRGRGGSEIEEAYGILDSDRSSSGSSISSSGGSEEVENDNTFENYLAREQQVMSLPSPMIPMIIGTTKDEGSVFVFTAYPTEMPKFIYQAVVFGFFRFAAPKVLKQYAVLSREQQLSPQPDYRLVLSVIIGDYLFKCPTQLFASMANSANASIYLYEFSLPTRTPGYPYCDGLACHTSELPYVFNHLDVINAGYSYQEEAHDERKDDLVMNVMIEDDGSSLKSTQVPSAVRDKGGDREKRSFFQKASEFFGGGNGGGDGGGTGGNGKAGDTEEAARLDSPPSRSVIDANVSDMMANFWVNFATSQNPNDGLSASKDYQLNTRQSHGTPLWVTLSGFQPRKRKKGIADEIGEAEIRDDESDNSEDDSRQRIHARAREDEYYRMHAKYASDLQRRMRIKSDSVRKIFNHQLVFDVQSEVHVIGDDCNCNFWNRFNYRF